MMAHHQLQRIAPVGPSRRSSIGRPAYSSRPGRSPTLNHQQHRSTGTALGRRVGMYRSTSAVGRTGRLTMGGLGCHRRGQFIPVVDGYEFLLPHLSRGEILGSLFGNLGTQLRWQAIGYVLPSHFHHSVVNAQTLDRGGHDEITHKRAFGTRDDR